jgi:ferric-dicitrate binding protein FerR (iron transport regulator)
MRHQRIFRKLARKANRSPINQFRGLSRNDLITLSALFVLLLSAAVYARADDQIRAVRLSNVVGSVQILAGTETQFSQAYPNMPLMQGSTLKTGEDGRAEIQFEDGSVVRLTPNSSAAMTVLSRDSSGNRKTEVDLLTGLSYVETKGTADQQFVVHFGGNKEVIPTAPVKFRVDLDANPIELAVLDGTAHVTGGTVVAFDVRKNETVRFDAGDSSRYFLAQGLDPDSWDQWNTDRDQAMGQMAAQETREAVGSGNAGGAGWSDLDYYGNWYAGNNGTSFWVPDGAGAGWDPYGSGYWGFYGGAGGYAWISGYPWGWLPYHCGTWNYFNTFSSWGWVPGGGCGNNWYPMGGFGNVPPRYHPLPRPTSPIKNPGGGLHPLKTQTLIAVDRGPEATTLKPRLGAAPKTIAVEGGEARLLPKTASPTALAYGRPESPAPGRVQSGLNGGHELGNVPVYRPSAPSAGYRAAAPSGASHPSGGSTSASQSSFSAAPPSAGGLNGASSSAGGFHGASGGGAGAGGGHVK